MTLRVTASKSSARGSVRIAAGEVPIFDTRDTGLVSFWLRPRHPGLRRNAGPAADQRMRDREATATEFYDAMGWKQGESGPDWVSDQATVLDLLDGDEDERFLTERVRRHYGVDLRSEDFALPFWLLLDRLAERRAR